MSSAASRRPKPTDWPDLRFRCPSSAARLPSARAARFLPVRRADLTAPRSQGPAHAPVQASQAPSAEAAPDHGTAFQSSAAGRKKPRKSVQTPNRSSNEGDDDSSMRAERTDRWNGRGYTGYAAQDRRRSDAGNDGRWRDERAERWDGRGFAGYAGQDRRRGEADDDSPWWRAERTDRWDGRAGYAGQDRRRSEAGDDGRWRDKRPRSGRGRASAGDDDEGRGGFGRDGADAREGSRGTRGLRFW